MSRRLIAGAGLSIALSIASPGPVHWQVSATPILSIGGADRAGPELFHRVAGLTRLRSGDVAVADGGSLELRVFDRTGAFVGAGGRRGEGPGEFAVIQSIAHCSGDSIFAYDPAQARVSVFDRRARFARSFGIRTGRDRASPPPYSYSCNATGRAVLVGWPAIVRGAMRSEGPYRSAISISLATLDGTDATLLGTFPSGDRYRMRGSDLPQPFGRETRVALGQQFVYVGTGDALDISVHSLAGVRLRTIRDTLALRPVTRDAIAQFVDQQAAAGRTPSLQRARRKMLEGLEYPTHLPAHGAVTVDSDDNLWVEEYRAPGELRARWRVYTPAGARLGSVQMPPGFQMAEVGRDYVLGVEIDRDGAELVRMYALRR
jgi:6-bladed beta-propeller protein